MKKSLSVLVYLFCAIFILINCTNKELSFIEDVDGLKVDSMAPFYHGVASSSLMSYLEGPIWSTKLNSLLFSSSR